MVLVMENDAENDIKSAEKIVPGINSFKTLEKF